VPNLVYVSHGGKLGVLTTFLSDLFMEHPMSPLHRTSTVTLKPCPAMAGDVLLTLTGILV